MANPSEVEPVVLWRSTDKLKLLTSQQACLDQHIDMVANDAGRNAVDRWQGTTILTFALFNREQNASEEIKVALHGKAA